MLGHLAQPSEWGNRKIPSFKMPLDLPLPVDQNNFRNNLSALKRARHSMERCHSNGLFQLVRHFTQSGRPFQGERQVTYYVEACPQYLLRL